MGWTMDPVVGLGLGLLMAFLLLAVNARRDVQLTMFGVPAAGSVVHVEEQVQRTGRVRSLRTSVSTYEVTATFSAPDHGRGEATETWPTPMEVGQHVDVCFVPNGPASLVSCESRYAPALVKTFFATLAFGLLVGVLVGVLPGGLLAAPAEASAR